MNRCQIVMAAFFGTQLLLSGCAVHAETVGERFDKAMKQLVERCSQSPGSVNADCDLLKLKPADPLATEEGRFAHSITVPNQVQEDSGYKPGMTANEYFDYLCKAEAGEFIFKSIENVQGIMQMRPREQVTDYMLQHLYALEDPYGETYGQEFTMGAEAVKPGTIQSGLVNPAYSTYIKGKAEKGYWLYKPDKHYKFLEKPIPARFQSPSSGHKYLRYTRPNTGKLIFEDGQYFYRKAEQPIIIEEQIDELKSQYGFTWRGIKRSHDRELGVAGGEMIVMDLQTNEVLAVRRGYLKTANVPETDGRVWWLSARSCPSNRPGMENAFIQKVLKPSNTPN